MFRERGGEFTPLPEANTDRISVAIALPFGLEERLGVDTGTVEGALQLAGFVHLRLESEKEPTVMC